MSGDCCRPDYDALFDARSARRQLGVYRQKGAQETTRRLPDAILAEGVAGASVMDIGCGVGVIGMELLDAGATRLTNVEASRNYIAVATHEVRRRGYDDRATFHHGDFVQLAPDVPAADIVTLDRVVCCYLDWEALVGRSLERATRLYGLVIPRDRWWMRVSIGGGPHHRAAVRAALPVQRPPRTADRRKDPRRGLPARVRSARIGVADAPVSAPWLTVSPRR